jgi:hypothetical protein
MTDVYRATASGRARTPRANADDILVNLGLLTRNIGHHRPSKDPNIVWVVAGGHLYGPNPERGVFMTTDGGKTWNKSLTSIPTRARLSW